jgi:hypothetical protein
VRITSADNSAVAVNIAVDQGGLPGQAFAASLSGTVATSHQRVRQRMEHGEWQTVGGVRWSRKTINFHDEVKRAEITTTELRLNFGMRRHDLATKPRA